MKDNFYYIKLPPTSGNDTKVLQDGTEQDALFGSWSYGGGNSSIKPCSLT